ncbi:MAG: hypothetical protein R2939_06685 [Kofleriaceae bacterium]
MRRPAKIFIVVAALAAAVCGAVAVQGGRFWVLAGDRVEIGPIHAETCLGAAGCQRTGLGWMNASALWVQAGTGTFAAGLILALCCVLVAATVAAGKRARLPAKLTLVAAATAAAATTLFVGTFPGLSGAEPGRGLVWMALAVVAAAAAAISTLRARAIE